MLVYSGPLKTRKLGFWIVSKVDLPLNVESQALLMDFLNTAEKRDRRLIHLPMGRFGEAVELAKAALFCPFPF